MDLLHETVRHKRFGTGTVTSFDGRVLVVSFETGEDRSFSYPSAFGPFLTAENEAVQAEAERAILAAFNELPGRRNELLAERDRLTASEPDCAGQTHDANLSHSAMQIRMLLELIDAMEEAAAASRTIRTPRTFQTPTAAASAEDTPTVNAPAGAVAANILAANVPVNESGACYDYEDFFRRTRRPLPDGIVNAHGQMTRFDNYLAVRHLDKIIVHDANFDVVFKAGISVTLITPETPRRQGT